MFFNVLVGHLNIFLGEGSMQVFCPVSNSIVAFFLLSRKRSLYILDTRSLSNIWFTDIFLHSVGCLTIVLVMSFDSQKCLILIKSNLSMLSFVAYAFSVNTKNLLPNQRS